MKKLIILIFVTISITSFAQKHASVSFEKWISLKGTGNPLLSPDGKTLLYTVNSTDWANNTYDSEIWMRREGMEPVQLTRTNKGSSFGARFTPDNKFVSFLADRGYH